MGLLIKTDRVPVKFGMSPDDKKEENTVYIKGKLNSTDRIFIQRSLFRVPIDVAEQSDQIDFSYSPDEAREINLIAAVLDWEGPIFEGQEYDPKIWPFVDLDDNAWWMDLVNDKINEVTKPQTEPPASNGKAATDPKEKNT